MSVEQIAKIGQVAGLEEIQGRLDAPSKPVGAAFSEALEDAIGTVDQLQQESESVQASFAAGEDVDLHDVLIKIEQAEIAFRAMMEVRTKLVDAYREVMRLGSGG